VQALIETVRAPEKVEGGARSPIFICGLFRSGSTLAERMLGRHSRVTPAGELEIIPALVRSYLQPYPHALAAATTEKIMELRQHYLAELNRIHPGWDIITDKRPDNFLHIGLIKAMFPGARIVHTRRHPLDNFLSIYFLHFAEGVSYGNSLDDIVHWYQQYRRLMAHWHRIYAGDLHDFDYDTAVLDPRAAIADLLEFCGLQWEDACLHPELAEGQVRTASAWQVREPIHRRSSGRWRNYSRELGPLLAMVDADDQATA
jgi:hypothetical protein